MSNIYGNQSFTNTRNVAAPVSELSVGDCNASNLTVAKKLYVSGSVDSTLIVNRGLPMVTTTITSTLYVTAADFVRGITIFADINTIGAGAIILPAAADIVTELSARGIAPVAGLHLPVSIIHNNSATTPTLAGHTGNILSPGTLVLVQDKCVSLYPVFDTSSTLRTFTTMSA